MPLKYIYPVNAPQNTPLNVGNGYSFYSAEDKWW